MNRVLVDNLASNLDDEGSTQVSPAPRMCEFLLFVCGLYLLARASFAPRICRFSPWVCWSHEVAALQLGWGKK